MSCSDADTITYPNSDTNPDSRCDTDPVANSNGRPFTDTNRGSIPNAIGNCCDQLHGTGGRDPGQRRGRGECSNECCLGVYHHRRQLPI